MRREPGKATIQEGQRRNGKEAPYNMKESYFSISQIIEVSKESKRSEPKLGSLIQVMVHLYSTHQFTWCLQNSICKQKQLHQLYVLC